MEATEATATAPTTEADRLSIMAALLGSAASSLVQLQEVTHGAANLPNTHMGRVMDQASTALIMVAKKRDALDPEALKRWCAIAIGIAANASVVGLELISRLIAVEVAAEAASPLVAVDGSPLASGASNLVGLDGRPLTAAADLPVSGRVSPGEQLEWLHPDTGPALTPLTPPFPVPTCTTCGCTEARACHLFAGDARPLSTCAWTQLDPTTNAGTCSACAE